MIRAVLGVSNTATSGKVTQIHVRSPSLGQGTYPDIVNFVANTAGAEVPGNEPPMDLVLGRTHSPGRR